MLQDPIADMLTRIRNANALGNPSLEMPSSTMKAGIAKILKDEGFISSYYVDGEVKNVLHITLKYGPKGEKVITNLQRISKPGLRVTCGCDDLPRVLNGLGIAIISTSNGLLTDKDARKQRVGGEVLAYVW